MGISQHWVIFKNFTMKIIFKIFAIILISTNIFGQVGINLEFQNRSYDSGSNTWTFDLVASRTSDYVGNWSGMSIRTNVAVPAGITIPGNGIAGTVVHNSVTSATYQNTFTGGSVAGTIKLQLSLDRATGAMPDLPLPAGTQVTLATFSVVFSGAVPTANLVTPRPFGGTAQSFYNTITDATARPFGLPAAFPLPITIKTFSATKDGERSSRLDWTSSSEINSDYIGIERSTDGEDWTTIGQVKAAGNSNRDIDYIYYDRSLPMARSIDNIFYYRLRLTDLDGQYKYSETRGVNMGRLEGLVSIYPNPATDIINVDLTDMDLHEGIIHLSVYDNTGKAIISKEVNGAGIEPIQASNMAAGTYNVVVKQGDTTHRKQIIVVN